MYIMSDSLLRALGWALAHSLWQGALVALTLLFLLPRLKTARQRYWTAYGALTALFIGVLGTLVWHIEPGIQPLSASPESLGTAPGSFFLFLENQTLATGFVDTLAQWLDANHALIVACWLIGFVFFLLRLGGGLWQVHRLRTRGLIVLEAEWQEKLVALSHRIGVSQPVRLLESALVRSPLTIGWLKPVILLPIGFVNQLSVSEVEAVLAHELAHIARRDWFFNLLQVFVESLFYYHPAVWWISGVVRRERENACDDAALVATGNPIAFARALVQVQEMATPLPTLALAMSGKRARPLLERVKRILNQPTQQRHQAMEKITATLILVALMALVGLRANSVPSIGAAFAQIAEFPITLFSGPNEMLADSLPKPKSNRKIIREDETGRVEAEYKDGKISRLNIDGKEIPEAEYGQHQMVIEELSENIAIPRPPRPYAPGFEGPEFGVPGAPAPPDAPRMFWFRTPEPSGAPRAPRPPMPPMGGGISIITDADGEGNTIIRLNGEVGDFSGFNFDMGDFNWNFSESFPEIDQEQMRRDMELARKEMRQALEQSRRNIEQSHRVIEESRRQMQRDLKRAEKDLRESQREMEKEQRLLEREHKAMEKEHRAMRAEHFAMEAQNKVLQEKLKRELLRDGLITNPNSFSMSIDSKTMKVNKKKQSEEMRRKYEELLRGMSQIKTDGKDWNFNFHFSDQE